MTFYEFIVPVIALVVALCGAALLKWHVERDDEGPSQKPPAE